MACFTKFGSASAIAILLASSPVFADVTVQDVWGNWRSYFGTLGHDISATEDTSGGTLTISNLSTLMALPENEGIFSTVFSEMSLRNNGDGTVTLSIPATSSLDFSIKGDDHVDGQLKLSQIGFNMVISGDPNDMSYSYTAAKIGLSLTHLIADSEVLDDFVKFDLVMDDLIGLSKMQLGDLRYVSQKFSAETLTYDVAAADPEGRGNAKFSGSVNNISFNGSGSVPLYMDLENPEDLFSNDFAFAGTYVFGDSSSAFSFVDKGKVAQGSSSSSSGKLNIALDANAIAYGLEANNLAFDASGSDLPSPFSAHMGQLALSLTMPLAKSDRKQPFGLKFHLTDMAVSNLTVSVAEAKLTGNGSFTFDNSDMTSFYGFPRPQGAADLQLTDGNGLIDTMVKMDLVPERIAMHARMMMGLFAVFSDGADSLKSRIEVNEQGHVLANGQRVK